MKNRIAIAALIVILSLTFVTDAFAINCVQFVKSATDIDLSGNAWSWWEHAAGNYGRGNRPHKGSVLVFKRTTKLPSGHIAVVSRVLDDFTVLIDHANWQSRGQSKGHVERGIAAIDCSPSHDWSAVCVWNAKYRVYGRPYPTAGFIYPVG